METTNCVTEFSSTNGRSTRNKRIAIKLNVYRLFFTHFKNLLINADRGLARFFISGRLVMEYTCLKNHATGYQINVELTG